MDNYNMLGIPFDASDEAVRLAYKDLALKWHPDRHLENKSRATAKFIQINRAYRSILRERRRKARRSHESGEDMSSSSSHSSTSLFSRETTSTEPSTAFSDDYSSSTSSTSSNPSAESIQTPPPSSSSSSSSSPSTSSESLYNQALPHLRPAMKRFSLCSGTSGSAYSESDHLSKSSRSSFNLPVPDVARDESKYFAGPSSGAYASMANQQGHDATDTLSDNESSWEMDISASPPLKSHHAKLRKNLKRGHHRPNSISNFLSKITPARSIFNSTASEKNNKNPGGPPPIPLPGYEDRTLAVKAESTKKEWVHVLNMTLEELFHGKMFCFRAVRCMLSGRWKNVFLDVDVPPGCADGTRIIFPGAGHERADGSRQDIVFLIEEAPHVIFEREHDDLIADVSLPWVDNLESELGEVHISGIDGEDLVFRVNFARDRAIKGTGSIPGAGMPLRDGHGRGKMVVRWEITASTSKWKSVKQALKLNLKS